MKTLLSRHRNDQIPSRVRSVHQAATQLKSLSDGEMRGYVNDLREKVHSKNFELQSLVNPAIAVSMEALRRVLGIALYDVQIVAAEALINGRIAEMQTGEGKTIAAVPAAVFGGVLGRGVHVATPNAYLAERDYVQLRDVYESLGLSVGHLESNPAQTESKKEAYACDITYGPGYEFGFDYLRDQMLLKNNSQRPRGANTIGLLRGEQREMPVQTRGLGFAIVDEIDNVLIDDASSPQVLSAFQSGAAPDEDAVLLAKLLASEMSRGVHYLETPSRDIRLTDQGNEFIYRCDVPIPTDQIIRPWARYVEAALKAAHEFQRDVHYVVRDDKIRIVEQSTGRIFEDRCWQAGIHQAVEAKEGVPITPESLPLAQITRQRFYRLYAHLCGMTGTASNCKAEFSRIYKLQVQEVPLRIPSGRTIWPTRAFKSAGDKWKAIVASVVDINRNGRPVLVGTRTIRESQILAESLLAAEVPFHMLNGTQDADEAAVISAAGQRGSVTIATNLAGRGTDIKLDAAVKDLGGLHVIVTECHASYRVDRQLMGRCARQGDPGSCQTFISAEDWLFTNHAPWFSESLGWLSCQGNENFDYDSNIRNIQASIERKQFGHRLQLLQQNESRNKILRRTQFRD